MNSRYLRFIQAIVLASLPACAATESTKESPSPTAPPEEQSSVSASEPREETKPVAATAEPTPPDVADAGVDAARPFSSGPIVPPELRVSLA
jgi:hypothetical protein